MILAAIQSNARYSNLLLAREVGLSPTPCWLRLRALEKSDVIQNYVTIFNNAQLGYPDTVLVKVALNRCDEANAARFEDALLAIPQVIEVNLASGTYDYYIKVVVSGIEGYERFVREAILRFPGIARYSSSFAVRCVKQIYSVPCPPPAYAAKRKRRRNKVRALDPKWEMSQPAAK